MYRTTSTYPVLNTLDARGRSYEYDLDSLD